MKEALSNSAVVEEDTELTGDALSKLLDDLASKNKVIATER